MSPDRDDELDAGHVGRQERLRTAYEGHRRDLLRLARRLGADEQEAGAAVEAAFVALGRRPWVRDAPAFLRDHVAAAVARLPRPSGSGPTAPTRRRRALVGAVVLAVGAAAAVLAVRADRHPPEVPVSAPLAPAVDVPAPAVGTVTLGRFGLAVLADPGVQVLDATGGGTALLSPAATGATAVSVSHDGRYVAALVGPDTVEVLDLADDLRWSGRADLAVWSPTADVLALDGSAGIQLLTLPTRDHVLESGGAVIPGVPTGIAWRPDGTALAVGTDRALALVGSDGELRSTAAAPAGTALDPVTWTADGSHLLVFDEPDGSGLNTYGVRVLSAAVTGGRLDLGRQLGATVPQPGWWSADGRTSVLGVLGTGYGAVAQQRVVRCDLTAGTCATLASGAVVDPVATASGIAYLSGQGSSGDAVVLADADGSHARAAPGAPAAEQVLADGDVLLLAGSDGIYRYADGTARRLAATDTDGAAGQGTEIVSWQPNARSSR